MCRIGQIQRQVLECVMFYGSVDLQCSITCSFFVEQYLTNNCFLEGVTLKIREGAFCNCKRSNLTVIVGI